METWTNFTFILICSTIVQCAFGVIHNPPTHYHILRQHLLPRQQYQHSDQVRRQRFHKFLLILLFRGALCATFLESHDLHLLNLVHQDAFYEESIRPLST